MTENGSQPLLSRSRRSDHHLAGQNTMADRIGRHNTAVRSLPEPVIPPPKMVRSLIAPVKPPHLETKLWGWSSHEACKSLNGRWTRGGTWCLHSSLHSTISWTSTLKLVQRIRLWSGQDPWWGKNTGHSQSKQNLRLKGRELQRRGIIQRFHNLHTLLTLSTIPVHQAR
jgi:hypothetical protein